MEECERTRSNHELYSIIVLDDFILTDELFPRVVLQRADRSRTRKPSHYRGSREPLSLNPSILN